MATTLRGFTRTVAATVFPGGAAGATFTVDGNITTGDTILSARHVSNDLTTNADITANASIASHNRVTIAVTNTTGNFVVLTYSKPTTV
jgi:hypothetical protein